MVSTCTFGQRVTTDFFDFLYLYYIGVSDCHPYRDSRDATCDACTACIRRESQYVDLSKLRKTSLKRYKKHFNLDVKAESKTELLEAVGKHFATMPVEESEVALQFYNFVRSRNNKRVPASDDHLPVANLSMNVAMSNGRSVAQVSSGAIATAPPLPSAVPRSSLTATPSNLHHSHHAPSANHAPPTAPPAKSHVPHHAPAAASGSAR